MTQTYEVSVKDLIKCKEGRDVYHFKMVDEGIEVIRHCEKPIKSQYKGLSYLIKSVIPGRVVIQWTYNRTDETERNRYPNTSSFHVSEGGEGSTFASILDLFLIKKAERLDIDYWPYNNSSNMDDVNINGESLIVTIRDKHNNEMNRVQINNTWLHKTTRMMLDY